MLLLAIPAFVPAIAVAGVVIYVAMRDRRSDDTLTVRHSETSGQDASTVTKTTVTDNQKPLPVLATAGVAA